MPSVYSSSHFILYSIHYLTEIVKKEKLLNGNNLVTEWLQLSLLTLVVKSNPLGIKKCDIMCIKEEMKCPLRQMLS